MEHDISKLEKQLETLHERLTELNRLELRKQLIPIIRQPWWTSVAEFALVTNAVESLTRNVETQIHDSKQLLQAAGMVKKTEVKAAA